MKTETSLPRRLQFAFIILGLAGRLVARADDSPMAATNPAMTDAAAPATNASATMLSEDPVKAWKQVQKANQPPFPPAEWSTNAPTPEEQNAFFAPKLLKAADLAREFYHRFPTDTNAPAAQALELHMVGIALNKFDQTNQASRLAALEEMELKNPQASEEDKLAIRMKKIQALGHELPGSLEAFTAEGRALTHDFPKREEGWQVLMYALSQSEGAKAEALSKEISEGDAPEPIKAQAKMQPRIAEVKKLIAGLPATSAALEKSGRDLLRDYPNQTVGYQVLMIVMKSSDPEKAKALATEIAGSSAPDQIKSQAEAALKSMERLNQPLDIQYTAVDGREVNLATMKDKVVLVDFWATWCGPCMAELPDVKAAYAKYHDQGFEIVGISLDDDKDKLEKTLKSKGMTWPQFFDGNGWKNRIAQQYGINSIPAMWLVDKQGKLSDMDARDGLETKIEKLLAKK